jgi:hypothetical protein
MVRAGTSQKLAGRLMHTISRHLRVPFVEAENPVKVLVEHVTSQQNVVVVDGSEVDGVISLVAAR